MKNSLTKAIKTHEMHMKNPKTATAKDQSKLMDQMKAHAKEMGTANKGAYKRR